MIVKLSWRTSNDRMIITPHICAETNESKRDANNKRKKRDD